MVYEMIDDYVYDDHYYHHYQNLQNHIPGIATKETTVKCGPCQQVTDNASVNNCLLPYIRQDKLKAKRDNTEGNNV